jgi:hypothetical protein
MVLKLGELRLDWEGEAPAKIRESLSVVWPHGSTGGLPSHKSSAIGPEVLSIFASKTQGLKKLCSLIAVDCPIATVRLFSTVSSRETDFVSDPWNGHF